MKLKLEKSFGSLSLNKVKTLKEILIYLAKKYGSLIWWIEFLIILNIKDITRWILTTFQIAPSDFLKKLFLLIKGGRSV